MSRFLIQTVLLLQGLLSIAGFALWQPSASAAGSSAARRRSSIPANCRILILPGFGNAAVDYQMGGSLVSSLLSRGWQPSQIDVLAIERYDWLKVFLFGALDVEFWRATASANRPAFKWYLDLVDARVQELKDDETLILVGHSAGGWLARSAVGYCNLADKIQGIVTLGAPNLPPPPQVMDMTRGALRITNEDFPDATSTGVPMVTVIGTPVKGVKQERSSPLEPTTMTGFAFNSYQAVCGDGTTIGDGVVPQCAAHIEGATQINLKNVFHSINVPDQWYGSENVIDDWHDTMLRELASRSSRSSDAESSSRKVFDLSKLLSF